MKIVSPFNGYFMPIAEEGNEKKKQMRLRIYTNAKKKIKKYVFLYKKKITSSIDKTQDFGERFLGFRVELFISNSQNAI